MRPYVDPFDRRRQVIDLDASPRVTLPPYSGPEPDDDWVSDNESEWLQRRADDRNAEVFGG